MVMLNDLDRYHLVMERHRPRSLRWGSKAAHINRQTCRPPAAGPAVHARTDGQDPLESYESWVGPTKYLARPRPQCGFQLSQASLVDANDTILVDKEFEVAEGRLDETQLATAIHPWRGSEAIGHRT